MIRYLDFVEGHGETGVYILGKEIKKRRRKKTVEGMMYTYMYMYDI